jgi:hypothetical protein
LSVLRVFDLGVSAQLARQPRIDGCAVGRELGHALAAQLEAVARARPASRSRSARFICASACSALKAGGAKPTPGSSGDVVTRAHDNQRLRRL